MPHHTKIYLDDNLNKRLAYLIIEYQKIHQLLLETSSDDKQHLNDQINQIFREISSYLYVRLWRVIKHLPSGYTHWDLLTYIFEKLPTIEIDPARGIIGLLITIARHKALDELRKESRSSREYSSAEIGLESDYIFDENIVGYGSYFVDPTSAYMDGKELWEEVSNWLLQVRTEDQRIFWNRLYGHSFRDIALNLGPGWTEDAVRQRYSRLIKVMRKHFKERYVL